MEIIVTTLEVLGCAVLIALLWAINIIIIKKETELKYENEKRLFDYEYILNNSNYFFVKNTLIDFYMNKESLTDECLELILNIDYMDEDENTLNMLNELKKEVKEEQLRRRGK